MFDPQTKTMTYIKICNPTKRAYIDFTKSTKKAGLHGVVTACVTLFDVTKKVKSE